MLTFFTTPKPFTDHYGVIQRNALRSWQALGKQFRVLVFGEESGAAEVCRESGLQHQPVVERNTYGTPLLSDLFVQAQRLCDTPYLCYINADILLMSDFARTLVQVVQRKKRFLLVGQRRNFDLPTPVDFAPGWEDALRGQVRERGQLDRPTAVDYFVFRHGMYGAIPPFAVGRTAFDNWLIYRARMLHICVVDATEAVTAVHQNHDYNHTGRDKDHRGYNWIWRGPEAKHNQAMAGERSASFTIWDATHTMDATGLHPRPAHTGLGGGIWSYRRSSSLAV